VRHSKTGDIQLQNRAEQQSDFCWEKVELPEPPRLHLRNGEKLNKRTEYYTFALVVNEKSMRLRSRDVDEMLKWVNCFQTIIDGGGEYSSSIINGKNELLKRHKSIQEEDSSGEEEEEGRKSLHEEWTALEKQIEEIEAAAATAAAAAAVVAAAVAAAELSNIFAEAVRPAESSFKSPMHSHHNSMDISSLDGSEEGSVLRKRKLFNKGKCCTIS
jgi:hypothetical protein